MIKRNARVLTVVTLMAAVATAAGAATVTKSMLVGER